MSEVIRHIPAAVRRQLRKEVLFGCAVCGCPILDYHHIIPWHERKHNEPEHMIAVCPTHHRSIGKMTRNKAYRLKQEPYNKRHGLIRGMLGTDKVQPSFVLGSITFINTPVILEYYKKPLISYRIEDGQSLISAYIPKADFWPELLIIDNEILVETRELWDLEFSTNYLKLHKPAVGNFLEIDLRGEHAAFNMSLTIGDENYSFGPKSSKLGTTQFIGGEISDCTVGISIGDGERRLIVPNYAMTRPRARLIE